METVKNLSFQDHHNQPKGETAIKISYFKTTTSTQSMETVKNLFFQDHHIQPKVEIVKNQLFQEHHILPKYGNC